MEGDWRLEVRDGLGGQQRGDKVLSRDWLRDLSSRRIGYATRTKTTQATDSVNQPEEWPTRSVRRVELCHSMS
jgi:hypothetical protein